MSAVESNLSTQRNTSYSIMTATSHSTTSGTPTQVTTATIGDESTATIGDESTANIRDESTAAMGDESTATIGDESTATMGDESTANYSILGPTYDVTDSRRADGRNQLLLSERYKFADIRHTESSGGVSTGENVFPGKFIEHEDYAHLQH